jgi:hypothetical protein
MSGKQKLHDLVEQIPAAGIQRAVEFLESLVEAPVDPQMLARIDAARNKRESGVSHQDILDEFGR